MRDKRGEYWDGRTPRGCLREREGGKRLRLGNLMEIQQNLCILLKNE